MEQASRAASAVQQPDALLRVLVADDEESMLEVFGKVLRVPYNPAPFARAPRDPHATSPWGLLTTPSFDLVFCRQGDEAVEAFRSALGEDRPFAIAFLDVNMPPGPDGIRTAEQIRALDQKVEFVIMTGASDVGASQVGRRVRPPEKLLFVQKPLHGAEIRQFAMALGAKWRTERLLERTLSGLEIQVADKTAELSKLNEELRGDRDLLQAALERRRELEYIVNKSGALVFLWRATEGWPVEFVSENVSQFGYTAEAFASGRLRYLDIIHADDRESVVREVAKHTQEGRPEFSQQYRIVNAAGEVRWLGSNTLVRRDSNGNITHYQGLAADITEKMIRQSLQAQRQKLEAIGQLAAGIAHEINTPTQYVGDNTRFLQDSFASLSRLLSKHEKLRRAARAGAVDPDLLDQIDHAAEAADLEYLTEEIPKAIEQSLEGIGRITKIVRAMKEFSHPGAQEKVPINLNHAIETTLTVAHIQLKHVADVVTAFDPNLPSVQCYPNEINQVVLNLLINAADAIAASIGDRPGRKGKITVQTSCVDDWAEIRIGDSGTGIPDKIRSRVFEPFFTTKDVGKGTGQGLALSHTIVVEKHKGTIRFDTEPGKGTTFIIRLPLSGEAL